MRLDDRAVVRRDAVEVAVGDPDQRLAREPIALRHRALRWWIRGEIVRVEEVAGRLSRLLGSVQTGIALSR
jgi:hypothetical protein